MPNLDERLIKCFDVVFPNLSPAEVPRASSASIATWDSLATVTLVSVIEEEFAVTIMPEEFENFVSFELIRECLKDKAANA
jgi:acyl carrier protein